MSDSKSPSGPIKATHHNISCNHCTLGPIVGIRYKCLICYDYDLCEACEGKNSKGEIHPASHKLLELREPVVKRARHKGVKCDGCGQDPLEGVRYKCNVCPGFDLCEKCRPRSAHTHAFVKIKVPETNPYPDSPGDDPNEMPLPGGPRFRLGMK